MRRGLLFWAVIALASVVQPGIPEIRFAESVSNLALISTMTTGLTDLLMPPRVWGQPGLTANQGVAPGISALSGASSGSRYKLRKGTFLGKFRVTFYWMVEEDNYQGKRTMPLYTTGGQLVGRFTQDFVKDFRMESCALLSDGRIISYLKRANKCEVVDAPIGCGYTLAELKSVAVDPSLIPVGSTLYIPEAEGTRLSAGAYHDGVFRADDIGSAIKGDRLDVYLGLKSNLDLFRSTALCNPGYVSVYLLQ
jgi:3D (Asp-Asp-Asp) domain-containing protein